MRYCKASLIILMIIFFKTPSFAQCNGDFSFQALSSTGNSKTGKIELTVRNAEIGNYTFKLYRLSGEIKLIDTKESQASQKIVFDKLEPADYYIKVEWGSCKKSIGGIQGIQIIEKAETK
jgi:hypothetical protein